MATSAALERRSSSGTLPPSSRAFRTSPISRSICSSASADRRGQRGVPREARFYLFFIYFICFVNHILECFYETEKTKQKKLDVMDGIPVGCRLTHARHHRRHACTERLSNDPAFTTLLRCGGEPSQGAITAPRGACRPQEESKIKTVASPPTKEHIGLDRKSTLDDVTATITIYPPTHLSTEGFDDRSTRGENAAAANEAAMP